MVSLRVEDALEADAGGRVTVSDLVFLPVVTAVATHARPAWDFRVAKVVVPAFVAGAAHVLLLAVTDGTLGGVLGVQAAGVGERVARGFGVWTRALLARDVVLQSWGAVPAR